MYIQVMIGPVNNMGTSYGDYAGSFSISEGPVKSAPTTTAELSPQDRAVDIKPTDTQAEKVEKRSNGGGQCETCKNRKYQDASNENVSFKSPTHISPGAAASAVRAHEGEHVANAYSKAAKDGGKVIQASVSIKTAICPECGKTYVAGGLTRTRIAYGQQPDQYEGKNVDFGT